jgi:hypothetical protein
MLMLAVQVLVISDPTVSDTTVVELDDAAKLRKGSAILSTPTYNTNTAEIPTLHTRNFLCVGRQERIVSVT